jgi:Poly(A) polymerase catalytic subunit
MSVNINSLEIVLDNDKSYEDIQKRKTQGFADIEKALEIVREYTVRKKRLIYGGMAIDISLRLAGHPGIYDADNIPDYDFFSPTIEEDANEIADILHKAGFEGVIAHNAQHATTRRVKINLGDNVADVSYMPKEIYDHIPTLSYKGLLVVHPLFQWMDVHRSFSQPFEKPPYEVISHRVHKDIKRYRLLYNEYYPFAPKKPVTAGTMEMRFAMSNIPAEGYMLGGYQAYAILYRFLHHMIDAGSIFHKALQEVGILDSVKEIFDKTVKATFRVHASTLEFTFPKSDVFGKMTIISDNFPGVADVLDKSMFAGKATREYYEMYGDFLRPRTILMGPKGKNVGAGVTVELFDNLGHMQPGYDLHETLAIMHKINPHADKGTQKFTNPIWITGPQNIVLYALQKYHDYNTPKAERDYHLYMYQSGIWIIECAEKVVNALRNAKGVDQTGFLDLYKKLPFFLTTRSYGSENWSADYLSLIYYKTYLVEGVPGNQQKKTRPTYSYNPERPYEGTFDVESSPIFQMSGKKVDGPLHATSLDPSTLN